jgi:hypothetical protein
MIEIGLKLSGRVYKTGLLFYPVCSAAECGHIEATKSLDSVNPIQA